MKLKMFENVRWPDLFAQVFIHVGALYGIWLMTLTVKIATILWTLVLVQASGLGITAGAHRLWSHRSYKAKWPLKLILLFLFTITGQRHVHAWALDHRLHHKYSETDADPHNINKGFFFAHIGWLFLKPHPCVVEKRKQVNMKDLDSDRILVIYKKLYIPLYALLTIIFPVMVPIYFWNESIWNSFFISFNTRYSITLNIAFLVNSIAHLWGRKPYNKHISAVENTSVSLLALGEGWHNFHHMYPFDYRTSEYNILMKYNPTTIFINFCAKIGWAYDLKYVSDRVIANSKLN